MSAAAGPPSPRGEIGPSRPTVILIDDDQGVRGALAFALELEGFAVSAFDRGAALLDAEWPRDADCLVIDFNLPDMTGLELLTTLRRRAIGTPAILITTHPPESVRRRAAEMSMAIVEKPLVGDALLEAIRRSVAAEPRRR